MDHCLVLILPESDIQIGKGLAGFSQSFLAFLLSFFKLVNSVKDFCSACFTGVGL